MPHDLTISKFREPLPKLEELIKNAPKEISYEPDSNGFYLRNDYIRMRYTKSSCFSRNLIEIWFLNLNPRISLDSQNNDMSSIPENIRCHYICAHTGSTFSFSGDNTFGIHRNPWLEIGQFGGPEEYFDIGSRILKDAARKYNLKDFYEKWMGKENNPCFLKRLFRL